MHPPQDMSVVGNSAIGPKNPMAPPAPVAEVTITKDKAGYTVTTGGQPVGSFQSGEEACQAAMEVLG